MALTPEQQIFMNWVNNTPEGQEWSAAQSPAPESSAPSYSNPQQKTGYSDDATALTFWDPNQGENGGYVTQDMSDATFQEKMAFRDANDLGYYTNSAGDYVYGIKPTSTYMLPGADDTTLIEGVDPNWKPTTVPDMGGIGRGGGTYDTEAGGQRSPDNTGIYEELFPENENNSWWQGSPSHDQDGNIVPGGPADPDSRPVYERGDPFIGSVNDTFGAGSGGFNSLNADYKSNIQGSDLDRLGYDSSSNKDFYQRQFADMRAQQMRQDDRVEQARAAGEAAATAPQGDAFGGDPWSWANLPDVVEGGVSDDPNYDPNAWVLNPNYGFEKGMTNAEMLSRMTGIFNSDEQAMINEHQQNPNVGWGDSRYWSTASKEDVTGNMFGGQNEQDPNWTNVLQKISNNIWAQPGDQPTAGGQQVPVGYASPTNA